MAKPGVPSSTQIRLMPLRPAAGSVLQATITRPQFWPLLMKVFWPLMTHSSLSRRAVARMALRSLPMPGSVMAMAPIISPRAMRGSQSRLRASVASAST